MSGTKGRLNFLARVSGNALDIVVRELALGAQHREAERQRLADLLGSDGDLEALRWKLVEGLRGGGVALDLPGLVDHLRTTVVNQIAIDQPRYSGFRRAVKNS